MKQDNLCRSGAGHGQTGLPTSKLFTHNTYFPLYFPTILPPQTILIPLFSHI